MNKTYRRNPFRDLFDWLFGEKCWECGGSGAVYSGWNGIESEECELCEGRGRVKTRD